jgi:two-component system, NarL family, invasion response regulator UvrY
MKKVLIADCYPLSRYGTIQILTEKIGNCSFLDAGNIKELFSKLDTHNFDLLILALSTPGRSPIDTLIKVKSLYNELPVLVVCVYPESLYALRAIKHGASGFITRESSKLEIIDAVSSILSGNIYFTKEFTYKLVNTLSKNKKSTLLESLSDRELQILKLIANGLTTKEISTKVNLGISTIGTYRQRIMKKLDLKTTAQMARFSMENNLI